MNTTDADDGTRTFVLTLSTTENEGIAAILEALAAADEELSVRDVRTADGETVTVDLDALTEKQRQTIVKAVELGYYATPRRNSLDELCGEFEVSKSAISQRIRKAESTLVRSAFAGVNATIDDAETDSDSDETSA